MRTRRTPEEIAEIRRLAAEGLSHRAIAAQLGLTRGGIRHWLRRPAPVRMRLYEDEVLLMRHLYRAGGSLSQIGRLFGVTPQGVAYHVKPAHRERMQQRAKDFQQAMRTA